MDPVVRYLMLMLALHRLIDLGLGQGPLAEAVREAMEGPERGRSGEEMDWINAVSEKLNAEREGK